MTSATEVIQGLVQRGLPYHVALGAAGNISVEAPDFQTGINEYQPLVPGSRGGYGLNQWTGPRRRQFEEFARSRGAALDDLDTQLDFTVWELQNTESRAGNALARTSTPEEAARVYSESYLRPGIPHLDRRIAATNQLAQMSPAGVPPVGSPPVGNTLAQAMPQQQQPFQFDAGLQDPRNFLTATQPVAYRSFT